MPSSTRKQNEASPCLTSADAGIELISLGRIKLVSPRIMEGTELAPSSLIFFIQASATSATPDLRFYDLVLIPIDEWSFVATTDSDIVASTLPGINAVGDVLECDGGVLREDCITKFGSTASNLRGHFEARGTLPKLPPDKQFQIHFVFSDFSNSAGMYESDNCLGASVKLYVHERWEFMRGAE